MVDSVVANPKRIDSLDSMRGVAALTVVVHHCLLVAPIILAASSHKIHWHPLWVVLLAYSPLHAIWAGHEAVVFFFILSGFVLTLPYVRGKAPAYGAFVVRRFFRIYVPYAVAIAVASVLLQAFLESHGVRAFSSWFNSQWAHPVTLRSVVEMLSMVLAPTQNFDTSTWSLVFEMRVSLIFPLLALLALRSRWYVSGLVALAMVRLGSVESSVAGPVATTIYWAAFFLAGATLARHREAAVRALRELPASLLAIVAMVGGALYLWEWTVRPFVTWPATIAHLARSSTVGDIAVGIGALIFMLMALSLPRFDRALTRRPLRFLGRISYSLYLIHPIVLLTTVYVLRPVVPLWLPVVLTPGLSIVAASVYYTLVERPALTAGRTLTKRPAPVGGANASMPRS